MTVYVELLEDVAEGGRSLEKAIAAADQFGLDKSNPLYPRLKTTYTAKHGLVEFRKGMVITMNEDGAKKWVDLGIGKVVVKPAEQGEQMTLTAADAKKV